MSEIHYFTFPLSPYAYLAGLELEETAKRCGAQIVYKPFGLIKVFEATGTAPVGQRHPSRQAYRLQDLERVARANDLPIHLKPAHWPTNPVPAMSALIAAQSAGGGDLGGLCHGFLRACWAEEKDIADDAVITALLDQYGFDKGLAMSGLLSGSETIERNTNEALERGVFGAPTYVVGDAVFWGQDRLPHLEAHLKG